MILTSKIILQELQKVPEKAKNNESIVSAYIFNLMGHPTIQEELQNSLAGWACAMKEMGRPMKGLTLAQDFLALGIELGLRIGGTKINIEFQKPDPSQVN